MQPGWLRCVGNTSAARRRVPEGLAPAGNHELGETNVAKRTGHGCSAELHGCRDGSIQLPPLLCEAFSYLRCCSGGGSIFTGKRALVVHMVYARNAENACDSCRVAVNFVLLQIMILGFRYLATVNFVQILSAFVYT